MRKLCGVVVALALALAFAGNAHALSGGTNISVANGTVAITGEVAPVNGGTGVASLTDRAVIIGRGTADVEFAAPGTAGRVLLDNGAGANPSFGALDLADADAKTGLLPLANGGTNANITASNGQVFYSTASAGALTTSGSTGECLKFNNGSAPTWGACGGAVPPVVFSSLGDVCSTTPCPATAGLRTVYAVPGVADATEGRGATVASSNTTLDNLQCYASVAPGASEDYVVTIRHGACTGALSAGSLTCTISGTGRTCTVGTTEQAVSAGNCYTFGIVGSDGAANSIVTCTAERTA